MHDARIISQPSIDFETFLGVAYEALHEKLYADTDRPTTDVQKFLTCLVKLTDSVRQESIQNHVSISVLAAYPVDDQTDITTICSGMSIAAREIGNGVLAVITGHLSAWQTALAEGTSREHPLFWSIVHQFDAHGLPHPCRQPRLKH